MTIFAVDARTLAIRVQLPLPRDGEARWTVDRKLRLVAAWHFGEASIEDIRRRWGIHTQEFVGWLLAFDQDGRAGLELRKRWRNPATIDVEARTVP